MAIDIDAVLNEIGDTGTYQRRVYFLLCLPIIFIGAINFSYVFVEAVPNYRCEIAGCDTNGSIYDSPYLNFTIPWNKDKEKLESCYQYKRNETSSKSTCDKEDFTKNIEDCESGIFFDKSVYESTVVTEFNLTCGESWQASADQSIFFAGILVGSFIFGLLSDMYGRRPIVLWCIFVLSVSGTATALVPNVYAYRVARFISAVSSSGVFQTIFILGMEFVGPRNRVMFGMVGQFFFAFGEVFLGLLALGIRNWRMLQLVISAPIVCFIFYYWVVPESVRWLQTKGRHVEVIASLENVAKINKKTIPLYLLAHHPVDHNEIQNTELTRLLSRRNRVFLIDVVKKPALFCRWISLIFVWIATTLCFYGLSYCSTDFTIGDSKSSPFIFFILCAVMELPGYTFAWFGMERCGRKCSLVLSLLFSGFFTIGIGYVKSDVVTMVLFLIGKCFITTAFAIIYIFTAELFPTSVRNTIVGTCSMFARIGGMVAPFAGSLKDIYVPLPMLVFGSISVLSGLFCLAMPETQNTNLPDTIEDALNLGRIVRISTHNTDESEPLMENEEEGFEPVEPSLVD